MEKIRMLREREECEGRTLRITKNRGKEGYWEKVTLSKKKVEVDTERKTGNTELVKEMETNGDKKRSDGDVLHILQTGCGVLEAGKGGV